jgi:uncharacterized lipoprotein YddW (UPF0748 family)
MKARFQKLTLLLGLLALGLPVKAAQYRASSVNPPKPMREFRGAWVASVSNIDWPSRPGLSTADQKAELLSILDRAASLKLNVIILQVRPACDALYASRFEPWSDYLTGTMGQAPAPFYDPLEFAVKEAHRRGLKLHAWFNPYRAHHPSSKSPIAANHISKTRPQLVRAYGNLLWLDPGEKEVQNHSLNVVLDVVKRYDIDGVHFDDYFYPYKIRDPNGAGADLDFPDDASWQRFGAGGKLARDDWRRENVNWFIERVYTSIKSVKPWVEFGVSPFGIWRPGHPAQIQGHDAYAKLYADSRLWISKGTLDYLAPQLYWAIDAPEQSFPALLKWWGEQNPLGRHLIPGLDSTKTSRSWSPSEIVNQIQLIRKQSGADGHIHWNMRSLRGDLLSTLQTQLYTEPALLPATPWLQSAALQKPSLKVRSSSSPVSLSWEPATPGDKVSLWVLQTRTAGKWSTQILPSITKSQRLAKSPEVIALTAIGCTGMASPSSTLELIK